MTHPACGPWCAKAPSPAGWSFSASLSVGTNVITVTGTNALGDTCNDSVTITRVAAPFVDVTHFKLEQ